MFFIPVWKWNRRYYVKTTCCGTVCVLNRDTGGRLARGGDVKIRTEDLTLVFEGHKAPAWQVPVRRCQACGYETKEDFDFCPKCGNRF